ncbi:MAG: MFS transporter [Dehalococcoidia bacterium]
MSPARPPRRDYMTPDEPSSAGPDYMRPDSARPSGSSNSSNGASNGSSRPQAPRPRRARPSIASAASSAASNGASAASRAANGVSQAVSNGIASGASAVASATPALTSPTAQAVVRKGIYYGYYLVAAAFIAQFVSVGSQNYVVGTFLKPMTEELDWTRSEYTLARTIGQFVLGFGGLFIGSYVDRHGGRRLMAGGIFVLAAAMFAISYVQELWQWLLLNGLVLTVGAALIGNLVVNVTLSKWFVEKRGRAIGFASMGVSFAGVALTPLATALVDDVGWRTAWRVLAIAAFAIILPLSFVMRRAPEDHGLHPDNKSDSEMAGASGQAVARDFQSSMTRAQALRTTSFYLIVFGFGLGGLSIGVMLVQTIPFMTDAGYGRGVAAVMISITSIPSMLTKPGWGYLIDKADPRRLTAFGFFVNAIAIVLIVFSVRAHALPLIYASYFLLGVGWGGLIPLQEVVWASFYGRRYLGSVRSAGLPFALIIQAGAPLATSIYFDRIGNYDGAFFAVAAAAMIAVVLVLSARPPSRTIAVA